MSTLADRLRGILHTEGAPPSVPVTRADGDLAQVLGGEWLGAAGGPRCFVVERRWDAAALHGRHRVGQMALTLRETAAEARHVGAGDRAAEPFVFFDLETTGLNGGAGTCAFLVGCGWFEEDGGFVTRQFLLTDPAAERVMLASAGAELARAGALVSFNGKSFDAPMLELRHAYHRLDWAGRRLPHLDVLHPARRFWGDRGRRASVGALTWDGEQGIAQQSACSLISLERHVLGASRTGDVPGSEIPARYFHFVRTGDARPLGAILEHNRLDLISLAGLAACLLDLIRSGPEATRDAREALALGRVYDRAGLQDRAVVAGRHALALDTVSVSGSCAGRPGRQASATRIETLNWLALLLRRGRRFDEAAACWQELVDSRGCPARALREASQALAIHHEHRARDLASARAFALRSLAEWQDGLRPAWNQAVRYRLARLEKKMGESAIGGRLID